VKRVAADMAVRTKHESFGRIRLVSYAGYKGTGQKRPRNAYRRQSVWENPILSSLSHGFPQPVGHEAYNRRLLAFLSPGPFRSPALTKAHSGEGLSHVAIISLTDLTRRLRELITALDRRRPRVGDKGEPAIARDAAALREKAVNRLAEIADQETSSATDRLPDRRS
jgi:hypothetical protein